jgi:predicted nucleotidyltransferase
VLYFRHEREYNPGRIMSKYVSYKDAWHRSEKEQHLKNEEDRKAALQCVNLLRDILIRQFGVKKIFIFGSILIEGGFNEQSDIDIAVEGLPGELYFTALAALIKESRWYIDLKPVEDVTDSLLQRIMQGKVIYEQGKNTGVGF